MRVRQRIRRHGFFGALSLFLATHLIGSFEARRERRELDRLFDGPHLRRWWAQAQLGVAEVPSLDGSAGQAAIAAERPDLIVRVSGGILLPGTFTLARMATLNVRNGVSSSIRGLWSIPWAIVEGRPDWIGATVQVVDEEIDAGPVVWAGAPQVAPADTGTTLAFRAHVEAVEQLVRTIDAVGLRGLVASPAETNGTSGAVYRSTPGVGAWYRYLRLGRGARAAVVYETALR
jgi:methionyl-tRNA formyltransferase